MLLIYFTNSIFLVSVPHVEVTVEKLHEFFQIKAKPQIYYSNYLTQHD